MRAAHSPSTSSGSLHARASPSKSESLDTSRQIPSPDPDAGAEDFSFVTAAPRRKPALSSPGDAPRDPSQNPTAEISGTTTCGASQDSQGEDDDGYQTRHYSDGRLRETIPLSKHSATAWEIARLDKISGEGWYDKPVPDLSLRPRAEIAAPHPGSISSQRAAEISVGDSKSHAFPNEVASGARVTGALPLAAPVSAPPPTAVKGPTAVLPVIIRKRKKYLDAIPSEPALDPSPGQSLPLKRAKSAVEAVAAPSATLPPPAVHPSSSPSPQATASGHPPEVNGADRSAPGATEQVTGHTAGVMPVPSPIKGSGTKPKPDISLLGISQESTPENPSITTAAREVGEPIELLPRPEAVRERGYQRPVSSTAVQPTAARAVLPLGEEGGVNSGLIGVRAAAIAAPSPTKRTNNNKRKHAASGDALQSPKGASPPSLQKSRHPAVDSNVGEHQVGRMDGAVFSAPILISSSSSETSSSEESSSEESSSDENSSGVSLTTSRMTLAQRVAAAAHRRRSDPSVKKPSTRTVTSSAHVDPPGVPTAAATSRDDRRSSEVPHSSRPPATVQPTDEATDMGPGPVGVRPNPDDTVP